MEVSMLVMCYGGGTNSAAILVQLKNLGVRPDLITFADTGAERPKTYTHIKLMSDWCVKNGFPEITTVTQVKADGSANYLYEACLEKNALPSLAYGFKSCSQKHKIFPQDKFYNNLPSAIAEWKNGNKIKKIIGYDCGESHRIKEYVNDKYELWYPLVDWGWHREDCVDAIVKEGLPKPNKSACFFCPSTKIEEIKELYDTEPELIAKAIFMEDNAELTQVKGLGRNYSWKSVIDYYERQADMFKHSPEISCDCFE
jgi:hypothetical protein